VSVRAGIIVTGTEVLTGRTSDRNGPWVSERLAEQGVEVAHITVVGDRAEDLEATLRFLSEQGMELIITTGGLGPTADDITTEVVAAFVGRDLVLDEDMEERITAIIDEFAKRMKFDPEGVKAGTRKQAMIPAGSIPLDPVGSAGYRGGFFHPATGYSLPIALRLACHVARQFPNVFGEPMRALHRAHRSQARYAQRLNALLFHAFPPAAMWNVFARFYRLPEALIARFYALRMTRLDRVRILVGRPPSGFSIGYAFSGGGSKPPSKQRSSKGGRPTRPVGAL
jgi:molybdenum cofactor synthesis domain-containing protein